MTKANAPGDVPTQGDCIDSPCLFSSVSVRKEIRDGEDAGDVGGSGAMCPMQVQILELDVALFGQESGSLRTPLNAKAAAFVPRVVYDHMGSSADQRTTVFMRNLPTTLSRDELVDLVKSKGFEEQFDFVYLPTNFASASNFGYAFVNCLTHQHAVRIRKVFDGFASWPASGCHNVCAVSWAEVQGFWANVARHRNKAIMHNQDVPDHCRPAVFHHGRQIPLPRATSESRAMLKSSSTCPGTAKVRGSFGQFVRVPIRPNVRSTLAG